MLKSIFSAVRQILIEDPAPATKAYSEGYRAFFNVPSSTSPYQTDTQEHTDWLLGQEIAQADRQW